MEKRSYYIHGQEKTHEMPDYLLNEPKKVLLLDDDQDLVPILSAALESDSYQVSTATNGVDGLRQVMATDFDAIVCDMVMPTLPGDMFYLAVEKTRPHLCKRFVFITGHQAEKKYAEFARSKGCLILWKPFELHVLFDAVQAIIKRNASTK